MDIEIDLLFKIFDTIILLLLATCALQSLNVYLSPLLLLAPAESFGLPPRIFLPFEQINVFCCILFLC